MAKAKATTDTAMRRCVGSTKFSIPAHEGSTADFPVQPSGKDGLGRMCKPHWTEYTRALRAATRQVKELDEAIGETATERAKRTRTPNVRAEDPEVARARALIAETDKLGGRAYLDAIASDEVQAALQVLAGTSEGPAIHEAMRQKQYAEEAIASDLP